MTVVTILDKKPLSSWNEFEFIFLSNLMVLTCDGAMMEERAGLNVSAARWLSVFSESLASLPPDLYPFSLWLLTIQSPHDSLLKSALGIWDTRLHMTGLALGKEVRGCRNRSCADSKGICWLLVYNAAEILIRGSRIQRRVITSASAVSHDLFMLRLRLR